MRLLKLPIIDSVSTRYPELLVIQLLISVKYQNMSDQVFYFVWLNMVYEIYVVPTTLYLETAASILPQFNQ